MTVITTETINAGLHGLDAYWFFEGSPVPTLVINTEHVVTHFNKACEVALGVPAKEVIGTRSLGKILYGHERPIMADIIVDGHGTDKLAAYYKNERFKASDLIPEAYEAEGFFPQLGTSGRWLFFTAAPLRGADGQLVGAIETLQDITTRKQAEAELMAVQSELQSLVVHRTSELAQANQRLLKDYARLELVEKTLQGRNAELSELNSKLSYVQQHLVQSEKLASIGQLAAGVAHEINNPIGYIFSNLTSLENYIGSLFTMLAAYRAEETATDTQASCGRLSAIRKDLELDFLEEDIPVLMRETKEGIVRVRKIVQDLKDFSHVDSGQQWQWVNLTQGFDSTLNIVSNEVKYKANVVREYGEIPEVECMASQINQVVMNLVINAAHAIGPERGTITIRTGALGESIWFEVADNGSGIAPEHLSRIFDPFYTTKPIGKGTGLGLSLSYGIVQKHHGKIVVTTELGKGTCFRVTLPVKHGEPSEENPTGGAT